MERGLEVRHLESRLASAVNVAMLVDQTYRLRQSLRCALRRRPQLSLRRRSPAQHLRHALALHEDLGGHLPQQDQCSARRRSLRCIAGCVTLPADAWKSALCRESVDVCEVRPQAGNVCLKRMAGSQHLIREILPAGDRCQGKCQKVQSKRLWWCNAVTRWKLRRPLSLCQSKPRADSWKLPNTPETTRTTLPSPPRRLIFFHPKKVSAV